MKRLCLLAALLSLQACASVEVKDIDKNKKIITISGGGLSYPPQVKYTSEEGQMEFRLQAIKSCPNGFKKISERYIPHPPKTKPDEITKDAYEYIIECN